jgi:hypothetical protein
MEVRPDARAEVLGLADIDDLSLGVFVEVNAGLGGEGADFLVEVHGARPALRIRDQGLGNRE